ncbi:TetR/AcrR family transcriptional regulator [Novosphingobium rosa]|uniref:TetR/AcrR family transcriptional regulator n=1 Tax=Novosphingobium rosa TaxID=76978 RepID=UPI000B0710F9|nr:TetR/AcrR family transcriptional regulator [Novosphingobium rosa]
MTDKTGNLIAFSVPDLVLPEREGGYSKGHETREMILRAALGLLIEEGYQAMSMRRVAAACGLKMGNLTYHFTTKEDLVRDLLDGVIRAYEIEFDKITHRRGTPPAERLAEVCQMVLEDIRTKKTTRLFPELWALSNHDSFVLERVQELYARARAPLNDIIEEMRPDLSPEQRSTIALFISASMEGMTVFAGHEKPFEQRMPELEGVSIAAFLGLIQSFGA